MPIHRSILILALLLFAAVPAFAQPPGPDFKATYERGMSHFHAKDFAKARGEFLAAYALNAEPTVLFAIAQTYRFEGNFKEAITWYKKFLGDSQAAQDLRTEAQTYLSESETRQKEIDDARLAAAAVGPKEADGRPATMPDGATTVPTQEAPPTPTPTPTDAVRTRRIPLGSKIAAGVTGAGLITSIVITKLALDVEKDFQDLRDMNMANQSDADRVERYQNVVNISWSLTAAAAITTVAIYFLAPSYTTHQPQVVVARNGEDGWSAAFSARF